MDNHLRANFGKDVADRFNMCHIHRQSQTPAEMLGIHVVFVVPACEHDAVLIGKTSPQMLTQETRAASNEYRVFHS